MTEARAEWGTFRWSRGGVTMRTSSGPTTHRAWVRLELLDTTTKVFEIDGASNNIAWSWRIAVNGKRFVNPVFRLA